MKILIVSDTHGRLNNLKQALKRTEPVDYLIHCGDICGDEKAILTMADCPTVAVAGNCDRGSLLKTSQVAEIDGIRAFISHGHAYHVSYGLSELSHAAGERHCSLAFYGHTHLPSVKKEEGITCINPGSLTLPRQDGGRPSYVVMTTDRKGHVMFTVNYL